MMSYDARHFRPTAYLLMLIGVIGYAIAAESFLVLAVGVIGVLSNALLVRSGRFKPIPRVIANGVTLLAAGYGYYEIHILEQVPVLEIGKFLLVMQLVKLWELRGNRDWVFILSLLSPLLMVAGLMNTASIWFGISLAVYLCVWLYCCLLFHLKLEADAATAALPVPGEKSSPEAFRQDQRGLGRSMRKLTLAMGIVGAAGAITVFVVFPRGNSGVLGPLQQFHASLTGFSDSVTFGDVNAIQQNHERVAYVKVWHNGKLVEGTETLLLRGGTLDVYRPSRGSTTWQWIHPAPLPQGYPAAAGKTVPLSEDRPTDTWRQEFTLWPNGSHSLFALPGVIEFTPTETVGRLAYSPIDDTLHVGARRDRLEYTVISSNTLGDARSEFFGLLPAEMRRQHPAVYEFARRPEVSGAATGGASLADRRGTRDEPSPLDAQIADNIERYLQTNFQYTLDLTNDEALAGREPLEMFLTRWKKGHCEYFAGAMALMCQTLGIQSRVVIGFKIGDDDYNDFTHSYTITQANAHAWVEVRTTDGWKTFDPTSSRDADGPRGGARTKFKQLLEFLEFHYGNAVIAYDTESREGVLSWLQAKVADLTNKVSDTATSVGDRLSDTSRTWLIAVIALGSIVAISVIRAIERRVALMKRAQRIGIESLPQERRIRLAEQLGFYDDLLQLLEDRRITRAPQLTPLEFSRSLAFLPTDVYDTVLRLTLLFYEVRFGGAQLSAGKQKHLRAVLNRLKSELDQANIKAQTAH